MKKTILNEFTDARELKNLCGYEVTGIESIEECNEEQLIIFLKNKDGDESVLSFSGGTWLCSTLGE